MLHLKPLGAKRALDSCKLTALAKSWAKEYHSRQKPLLALQCGPGHATKMVDNCGRGSSPLLELLRVNLPCIPVWVEDMNELKVAVRVGQAVDVTLLALQKLS